jgi:hypothetical protein
VGPLVPAGVLTLVVVTAGSFAVPSASPVVLVPAVVLLPPCRIQVTFDHRGLRVVTGLLELPLKRVPLDAIASSGAEQVIPWERGGWGYRVGPGRSAVVLRSGPGVVVRLTPGRRSTVAVDDADTAAALLTTLRARV